jgi:uncharacterized damage-inducible protein DinB
MVMPSSLALSQLRLLSQYSKWAHSQLWAVVESLSDEDLHKNLHLPFGSIAATYNHMLAGDLLWYSRFTGLGVVGGRRIADLVPLWVPSPGAGQWNTIPGDEDPSSVARTYAQIIEQCERWTAYTTALTEADLEAVLRYTDTSGKEQCRDAGATLLHVFNHGTHHRGQISGILTALHTDAPCMDLLYFLDYTS